MLRSNRLSVAALRSATSCNRAKEIINSEKVSDSGLRMLSHSAIWGVNANRITRITVAIFKNGFFIQRAVVHASKDHPKIDRKVCSMTILSKQGRFSRKPSAPRAGLLKGASGQLCSSFANLKMRFVLKSRLPANIFQEKSGALDEVI